MEIPEFKGTYILVLGLPEERQLQIGRLGTFAFAPGFYTYVGSAFGSGGLKARVGHHLGIIRRPRWHIDYLLEAVEPLEVWFSAAPQRLEASWAEILARTRGLIIPVPGFGASDYRTGQASHLCHSGRKPSFRWFQARAGRGLSEVRVHRHFPRRRNQRRGP